MMKTDDKNINTDFYNELLHYTEKFNARITYSDGNDGWFNPELMKIVLDEMLTDAGVQIYFNSDIYEFYFQKFKEYKMKKSNRESQDNKGLFTENIIKDLKLIA